MDDNTYYEDGVTRVLRLMKDTFGDQITTYYKGELLNVPELALPCLMVSVPKMTITGSSTATDEINEEITIIIVLNKKDDLNSSDTETDLTEYRLQKMVYGQDATTGQFLPNTAMYAIRKHFTMNSDTLSSSISVDFTPNVRGEGTLIATQEAYITISLTRHVVVVRD